MQSTANSVEEYLDTVLPVWRKDLEKLRQTIRENLPGGYQELMSYGMIGYAVPLERYPEGYHANPSLPLPFINLAAQKNYIALYHLGIYSDPVLLAWFKEEYARQSRTRLDMGKSCIRFRKNADIPFPLIAELASKITVEEWIRRYESGREK